MKTKLSSLLLATGVAYCIYAPSPASAAITGAVTNQDIYLTPAPAFRQASHQPCTTTLHIM